MILATATFKFQCNTLSIVNKKPKKQCTQNSIAYGNWGTMVLVEFLVHSELDADFQFLKIAPALPLFHKNQSLTANYTDDPNQTHNKVKFNRHLD